LGADDDQAMSKRNFESMKKLFILGQLSIGGTENQVLMMLKTMKDKNENVQLIAFRGGPGESFLRQANIPYRILSGDENVFKSYRAIKIIIALTIILSREEKLLIEVFLPQASIITVLINITLRKKHKVIVNRRSLYFYRSNVIYRILDSLASRKADLIVANSKSVYHDIIKYDGIKSEKVTIVPNGIELFATKESILDHPNIYCIANLHKYKDHKYLIEAFSAIANKFPKTDLNIFGEGPELKNLKFQIEQLGLNKRVHLHGLKVDAKYSLAPESIFMLPSKTEGMSNALMEAMSIGMVCIARDVGGNAELMGDSGIIIDLEHEHFLSQILSEMLSNIHERKELSRKAYERIRQLYTIEKVVTQRLAMHRKILR
jgi:glycosyltransferase involved in cell wall biosynthesis